ncbi:hypothetical protein QVD17_06485 [Tagetes erecta]|uniref:BHLH domain-containing protein n=1 Tax=Tagetes erecta TaxID=13708 RepID=A0AAD8PC97_TARER|nr:hypothetical protein QVD17_06485 [Tagetes erecta]
MDVPYGSWFQEPDTEDRREFMYQLQETRPFSTLVDSFSSQGFKGYQNVVMGDQAINASAIRGDLDKQEGYNPATTSSFAPISGSSSNTFTISFGDFNTPTSINQNQNQLYGGYKLEYDDEIRRKEELNLNELLGSIELPKRVSSTKRNHRQAQEHILAERKRREKLTQRFITLSSLLPEIKKMDKATVLEDASKYIKHLQNRVKELEQISICEKNIIQESTISTPRKSKFHDGHEIDASTSSLRKSKFHGGHELDASSFDETNSLPCSTAYNPGIKVRTLGSNVLVRIYCKRDASLALKALTEMERLHLTVMSNSVLPISSTAALITVIAQMSEEFEMTAKDLVRCLQLQLSLSEFR